MTSRVIEVSKKEGFGDPAAGAVLALAREWGVPAERVRTAVLYLLEGTIDGPGLERLAGKLLADPVTEEFRIQPEPACGPEGGTGTSSPGMRLDVWLKPQVSDPVAPSVERGASDLGFALRVRCGRRYKLYGRLGAEGARLLAWKALANPIIHDCSIAPLT